jgi:gamma-glutamyltranspeptidase / glutathione hydrolase
MRCFLIFAACAFSTLALTLTNTAASETQKNQNRDDWHAEGKTGAVCVGGKDARDASLEMLKRGGNAADAAAVATLIINVTDGSVCFGGEAPIMFYDGKTGAVEVLSGQGAAPRLATREYFASTGGIPSKGIKLAAIPGTLDAVLTLVERRGTKTFAEIVEPTLKILDGNKKGYHANLAKTFRRMIAAEKASPNDRKRGIRLAADYFYRGPIAREIDEWMKKNNGLIRYTDLATHVTRIEEPLSVDYRGFTVLKCDFWSQGPCFLQMARILEGFDLKSMGYNQPDTVHVMIETMKLCFADRDIWYGDPLFANVPAKQLLAPEYAATRRSLIDMKKSSREHIPGDPTKNLARLEKPVFPKGKVGEVLDTSAVLTVDQWGNAVAVTPSGKPSQTMDDLGIVFGSRLHLFNIDKNSNNCIEPGKRPRTTLSPGMVLKNGKPVLLLSTEGGDYQEQALIQYFVGVLDFGLHPKDFASKPRFGTDQYVNSFGQVPPKLGSVLLDAAIGQNVIDSLKARGAVVTTKQAPWSSSVMIYLDSATGMIEAAGEVRRGRYAGAY